MGKKKIGVLWEVTSSAMRQGARPAKKKSMRIRRRHKLGGKEEKNAFSKGKKGVAYLCEGRFIQHLAQKPGNRRGS